MRRAVALLAVVLVVAACSGDDDGAAPDGSSTTSASTTTTAPPSRSSGCGGARPEVDERHLVYGTLESSGGTREYMVYVPDAYDPDVAAPVAYVFHGAGSNKEQQLAYSAYPPYADADGALLVLPDALGGDRPRWSPFGPGAAGVEGVNDIQLFDDLSAEIEATYCVDAERVLVTGMSSGGYMASAVGCVRSTEVSAVGPVTATVWREGICGGAEPVPYAYFHGTADAVVPYDGGSNSAGPVPELAQGWAEQNGCDPEPVDEPIGDDVVHRTWQGCDAPTDLYTVIDGGHAWPGAINVGRLGHNTETIDATEIIWQMFVDTWPEG